MFGQKSGGLLLLESLLPPEIWAGIKKATDDIPRIVTTIQETMVSIDARLETIQLKLEQIEMKLDKNAVPITALTLMDERVQNGHATPEDIEIMTNIPV